MKRSYWVFALFLLLLVGCGKSTEQEISERFEKKEQQVANGVTVTPILETASMPVPTPTVAPTSTPMPTSTTMPTPTIVLEDYGDDIFVFDREYTNEWAWIEVCFWLKDADGNPIADELCELEVNGRTMIKSPMVVDYYDSRLFAVTDEEGKAEFIVLEQKEDGDTVIDLVITTSDSRHTEKIYCVDPVRTVPTKPEVTVQQTEYIKLSWEKDYDARWYYIERRVNDGEYELVEKTDLYDWYSDSDVKSGNTYYYRVYGGNYAGYSEVCEVCVPFIAPMEDLGELKVNDVEVNVISHISEEQASVLLELLQEGGAFLEQCRKDADIVDAVQRTAEFLRAKDGVAEVGISEGYSSIWFVTGSGIMGAISVDGDDKMD